MKKIAVFGILFALVICITNVFAADVNVRGYFRNDGTYVQPHVRSAPDSNPWNNYSTKGNINPYTGERGYQDPYRFQLDKPNKGSNRSNYDYWLNR